MSFKVVTTPSARKSFKKIPISTRKKLVQELKTLSKNPFLGKKLHGKYSFLFSYHYQERKVQYRVIYEVMQENREIVIHYGATRENFYKELSRLQLKSMQKKG